MNPHGELCTERVPGKGERVAKNGREYKRSLPLSSIKLTMSLESRPTWATRASVRSGILRFDPHAEDEVIKSCPSYGNVFQAYTLEKVNNAEHGDDKMLVGMNFYPALHRMLQSKQEWGHDFKFRGRSIFGFGVLEWTETILETFKDTLYKAGIYGAVAVSRYPYECSKNVWRAFCELWGPLSNTLHFADGEMSISLSDLQVIGGLPISGIPYEEFLPTNKDLRNKDLYPPTVLELLQIHSALCIEYGYNAIYWDQWLTHFFRGELIYASPSEGKAVLPKPRTPKLPLRISEEGKLAAFIVFWLCRFVLPAWDKTIRPETFHMACLMAKGVKVSIAPTTLGYIYHRLGEIASHPVGDVPPKVCLPIHYVLGWLGEYFPQLCKRRADSEFPADYPRLARYAYVASKDLSITCARMVFRDNKSVIYRPHAFLETEGCFLLDDETLSDERFEFLFGIRSACLPVRVDGQLILEPYYPNRFARQFGYDQSVPSNRLSFSVSKRKQCFVEDLARAQSILYRRNTTAQFYIPRSTREGECTWWYCKWWLKACIPYLGLSVSKTFKTFTQKSPEPDHRVFIVNKLAEVSADLRKEVQISSLQRLESQNLQTSLSKVGPDGDNLISSEHINHDKMATLKGTVSREVSLPKTRSGTQKALKRKPDSLHPSNPSAVVRNVQQTESGFSSNTDPSRAEIVARTSKRQPVERQSNGRPQRAQTTIDQGVKKTDVPQKACISSKNPSTKCMPTVEDVGNFLSAIVDPGLALFMRNYLIGHVSDIFVKVSSSKTPEVLLAHREEIQLALGMLHPVIESLKSGKDLFEKFTSTIRDMLAAAVDSSRTIALLKESTGVDVEFADNLISDYEACMKVKQDLDSRLADSSKKLQDLQATELDIKADEERVRKRRRKHDSQKASIENTIKLLKESIKEQEDQGRQLLKEKSDCVKDKLPEIEQAKSSSKLEREKYQKSFDSFISLFPTT